MGKKVLFVTPNDIYDEYGIGGVKGTRKNYKLIAEYFGKENTYLCTFPKKEHTLPPQDAVTFKRTQNNMQYMFAALLGCKVYFPWNESEILDYIDTKNIDLLFIDSSIMGRLVRVKKKYKSIVFFHNIETDYAWNKVKKEGIWFLPSYLASKYNDKLSTKADAVICINERDSKRLFSLYGRQADFILPVTFEDIFAQNFTTSSYKREILFVGSLFPPNQLSIEWFMQEVMPKLNNIHLHIVGKYFESKKEEYEKRKNVYVIGSVNQLDVYYYQYAAVVLPIRYGAGMKVKTAEAMMYGRRIFATDEALEGYDVDNVSGIVRCNSADDFANAINHYFDKEDKKTFEPEVRARFLEKYETGRIVNEFNSFLNNLLDD